MKQQLILLLMQFLIIVIPVLISVAYLTLFERKVLGYSQLRKGPNVVGIYGVLQPLADGVKLFTKETVIPSHANAALYFASPILALTLGLVPWFLLPWNGTCTAYPLYFELSLLILLALLGISIFALTFSGYSSNSKYAFIGGIRAVAQMISYEVSLGIILLSVVLVTGTMNIHLIHEWQSSHGWVIWLIWPVAIIYFVSSLAETNRAPFDLTEGESELVSGYNVEYASMPFALFFLAEYSHIIFSSFFFVILFTGGQINWFVHLSPFINVVLNSFLTCSKVVVIMFVFVWARTSLPRIRYEQLMGLLWKNYLPLSLSLMLVIGGTCRVLFVITSMIFWRPHGPLWETIKWVIGNIIRMLYHIIMIIYHLIMLLLVLLFNCFAALWNWFMDQCTKAANYLVPLCRRIWKWIQWEYKLAKISLQILQTKFQIQVQIIKEWIILAWKKFKVWKSNFLEKWFWEEKLFIGLIVKLFKWIFKWLRVFLFKLLEYLIKFKGWLGEQLCKFWKWGLELWEKFKKWLEQLFLGQKPSFVAIILVVISVCSAYLLTGTIHYVYIWLVLELVSMLFIVSSFINSSASGMVRESLLTYVIISFASFILLLISVFMASNGEYQGMTLTWNGLTYTKLPVILIYISIVVKLGMFPSSVFIPQIVSNLERTSLAFYLVISKAALLILLGNYITWSIELITINNYLCLTTMVIAGLLMSGTNNMNTFLGFSSIHSFAWVMLLSSNYCLGNGVIGITVSVLYFICYSITVCNLLVSLSNSSSESTTVSECGWIHKLFSGGHLLQTIAIIVMSGLPPFIIFTAKVAFIEAIVILGYPIPFILVVLASSVLVGLLYTRIIILGFSTESEANNAASSVPIYLNISIYLTMIAIFGGLAVFICTCSWSLKAVIKKMQGIYWSAFEFIISRYKLHWFFWFLWHVWIFYILFS